METVTELVERRGESADPEAIQAAVAQLGYDPPRTRSAAKAKETVGQSGSGGVARAVLGLVRFMRLMRRMIVHGQHSSGRPTSLPSLLPAPAPAPARHP